MDPLMVLVALVLLRVKRAKLKIKIDLKGGQSGWRTRHAGRFTITVSPIRYLNYSGLLFAYFCP